MQKQIALAALLCLFSPPAYAEQHVTVMTYNVLLGFHGNHQLQRNRLDAAKTIVKRNDPDILLLQEAFYAAPNSTGIFLDYQKEFSYPHAAIATWGDYGGNVILSKYPIQEKIILPLGTRTALRTKIAINQEAVTIDNIHLSPYIFEDEKVAQLEHIVSDGKRYIIGGDFNAFSPHDTHERQKLLSDFTEFYGSTGEMMLDNWLSCGAIKAMENHCLHDARTIGYTYPTSYLTKNKNGAMRIDFLFYSSDIAMSKAGIEISPEAEQASDHYPVIATFHLNSI